MDGNRLYLENQEVEDGDYIDLTRLFKKCIRIVKRYVYVGIILMLVGAASMLIYAKKTYNLQYDAYVTCSISDNFSLEQTTSDINIANQMGKTFTYIVNSGVLKSVVAKDLGISHVSSQITARPLANTSMITVHVYDKDPAMAWKVLNSVMDNYHQVAEYIIGSTTLSPIDSSGVPTKPMYEINYFNKTVKGMAAGLAVFGLFVIIMAVLYKSIETPKDVTNKLGIPLLAVIPHVEGKKRSVDENPVLTINKKTVSPSFVEGFRLLGNRLEQSADQILDGGPVIMVTSTDSGEGKSTVAMNLALLLAQRGHKVLLMDCDMHKPSLAKQMSITKMTKNIYTVLKGQCEMEEALGRNKKLPLHFLGEGYLKEETEGISLLSSRNMRALLETASLNYDFVIVDTPPMSLFSDAAVIAPLCDSAIYVVRDDYAPAADVFEQMGYLCETGVKLEGFVFNGATSQMGGAYGYGYGYGYNYNYGGGYKYGGYGKKYNYGSKFYGDSYGYGPYAGPYAAREEQKEK